ncbi:hypothetical protein [Paenibacillus cisolokensis]|uniref:hypothetical protein n=1 Tax=Paenibacillus cisolokensis TaxID=1658519 RepID=UPI003D2B11E4
MRILLHDISDVHELKVYDTAELYGVKGRYRVLEFSDQAVQGAMDLDDPARIVLEYPRAINAASGFGRVFQDGVGEAA